MKQEDLIKKLEEIKTPEIKIQSHKSRLKTVLLNSGCFKEDKIMNMNVISVWFKKIAPVGVVFALLLVLGGGYLFLQEDRVQKQTENQAIVPASVAIDAVSGRAVLEIHPDYMKADHMKAFEKLVAAKDDLIAAGIPIMGIEPQFGYVDPYDGTIVYPDYTNFLIGLREVREEYKAPIKAVVEGIERVKFDFFQADFSVKQLSNWQDQIVAETEVRGIPIMYTTSSFRDQKIFVFFNYFAGEIKQEYKDAIRAVVGDEAPLEFRLDFGNPHQSLIPSQVWENNAKLMEVSERIVLADLAALGIPLAGFYVDARTVTIYVGLTEIKGEYTEPIKAIVNEVEGVNLVFFKARFTEAELRNLQRKITEAFQDEALKDIPLTMIGVDIKNNELEVGLREIKPQYIEAIRRVVGDEVPIEFLEVELIRDSIREYYGWSTYGQCQRDNDCFVSGCNAEICQSRYEEPLVSICIFPDQPTPKQLNYGCRCVNQRCEWSK